jgi:hypothetical protein
MKIKNIMMSIMLTLCSVATFAAPAAVSQQEPLPLKWVNKSLATSVLMQQPATSSCTVVVKFGKITSTVTSSCECTMKEACAAAYKLATILL